MVRKGTIYYINSAITLLFMFGFGWLPPIGEFSSDAMKAIGIFIGMIWGWTTVGAIWPSICIFVALTVWNFGVIGDVVAEGFGSSTVVNLMVLFAFALYIQEAGLARWMANWFISRKISQGRPWLFALMFFTSCTVITGIIGSPFPVIVIMSAILYEICDLYGYENKSKYMTMMIAGINVSTLAGAIFTPWTSMALVITGALTDATGITINAALETAVFASFGLINNCVMVLIFKYIFRVSCPTIDTSAHKNLKHEKMNRSQRSAFIIFCIFGLTFIVIGSIPTEGNAVLELLGKLGLWGLTGIVLIALSIARKSNGEARFDIGNYLQNGMQWSVIFMLAASVPISSIIEDTDTGIIPVISRYIVPFLSNLSPIWILIAICAILSAVTQLCHNVVLALVFIPLLVPMMPEMGVSPIAFALTLGIAVSFACVSPASSSNSAMCYADSKHIDMKYMYLYSIGSWIGNLLLLLIVYIPVLTLIFPG